MKRVVFGVFAHPDDEAFGPAGTLLREVREGAELHLITLTAGENGPNPDNHQNLAEVRLEEWHRAGKLFGATNMHHLGYIDGQLDNIAMLDVAQKIEKIVSDATLNSDTPLEIEFISMDTNGITGHIDHIVASRAAHLAFYRLKDADVPVKRLRLACLTREYTGSTPNIDFVYMEPGRLHEEIDETVDSTDLYDEVINIMRCYHTQRDDCNYHLDKLGNKVAIDHFIVRQ